MDSLRRTIKYNGYKINGVMNITDVGHLTSDEDSGEDKMEKAAKRENKSPYEIAKFYSDIYFDDLKQLNIDLPEHITPATQYIEQMIDFDMAQCCYIVGFMFLEDLVDFLTEYRKIQDNGKDKEEI